MTGYTTMAELFEAEANGFGVVIVMRKRTAAGTDSTFVRLVGPFADRSKARNKAATLRKRAKKWLEHQSEVELLGVHIEPLWINAPLSRGRGAPRSNPLAGYMAGVTEGQRADTGGKMIGRG